MRKFFLFHCLFVIYLLPCLSQSPRIKSYKGQDYFLYEEFKEKRLWTGVYDYKLIKDGLWIQLYKEDTLKVARIFSAKNSKFDGIWKEFYFSGQISREGMYVKGKKWGDWREWYETGKLKNERSFIEGKKDGKYVSYYPNGMVSHLDLPNHLGLDSLLLSYHENGTISRKRVYSDVTYKETIYYSNGQLFSSQTYFDNRLIDTIQIYFHRNGKILATGKTKHAARIGPWKFFYKNGQLRAKGKYSQGTKEFCNKFFSPTFYHYKIGYWEYWYENGLPMARGHYEPLLTESIDGGIPEEIQVTQKESDWKFWNQEGSEITEFELYKAGLFKEYPPFYSTGEIEP